MTTTTARNRMGTQDIYDQKTGLSLTLPGDFMIHQRHEKVWTGGSDDLNAFLLVERIPAASPAPTLLADGDLDIFIASAGQPENEQHRKMTGTIRGYDVTGHLYRSAFNGRFAYLVFMATLENQYHEGISATCQEIGQMIAGQAMGAAA